MKTATYSQVHIYLSRALDKKLNLEDLKNTTIEAGWTIILDKEELDLGDYAKAFVHLCHHPEDIKQKTTKAVPKGKPKAL